MPTMKGVRYKIRTYPSGKRVRLGFIGDRVVETKELPRARQTKTSKRLKTKRRRIGR